ncbi:MAG: GntR family transcriptional regulator [Lachnospiraceae bacterium]|nr:GntR family transcriptional regulator [Lachnospiraceae bacterium]
MENRISNSSKKDEAYEKIKERIISGEYRPGSLLVERTISDSLGMSRTPIRAALMDLCHSGLAEFTPGKGISVSVIGRRDIEEIYELRSLLDTAVLISFMKISTPEQIAHLRSLANNMLDAVNMEDVDLLIKNDIDFHQYYTDYCENSRLAAIICSTVDPFCRFRYITTSSMRMNRIFVEEHLLIMDAIEANDQAEAELQMKAHYSHLKRYQIQKLMQEGQL